MPTATRKKLQLLFWPFLLIMVTYLVVYMGCLWWFVLRHPHALPEEKRIMMTIPPLTAWIPVVLFMRRGFLLLEDGHTIGTQLAFTIFTSSLIFMPVLLLQDYFFGRAGVITDVRTSEDLFLVRETKFYKIRDYYLDAKDAIPSYGIYQPAKTYYTARELYMRYAIPIRKNNTDNGVSNVWLVTEYSKIIKHYLYMDGAEIAAARKRFETEASAHLAGVIRGHYKYFALLANPVLRKRYDYIRRHEQRYIPGDLFYVEGHTAPFAARWSEGIVKRVLITFGALVIWFVFSVTARLKVIT